MGRIGIAGAIGGLALFLGAWIGAVWAGHDRDGRRLPAARRWWWWALAGLMLMSAGLWLAGAPAVGLRYPTRLGEPPERQSVP